jgi:hypothetical protein
LSLPRSGRGASRAAPARGGRPGVFVQAPKPDIYVALLAIALGAMLIGCLLMVLILNAYDFELKATAVAPPAGPALAAFSGNPTTVHL